MYTKEKLEQKESLSLTNRQKALVVSFSGSLIADDCPDSELILQEIMGDLNLTMFDLEREVLVLNHLVEWQGMRIFDDFKSMPQYDKNAVQKAVMKAFYKGGNNNNPATIMLLKEMLSHCGIESAPMPLALNVRLDNSVKSISCTAAYHLSSVIANGIALSQNNDIIICKGHIDFGECNNSEYRGRVGNIFSNFYIEYGHVIYRFGSNLKCGWLSKRIDYVGAMTPTSPDNPEIFNFIYPRFA